MPQQGHGVFLEGAQRNNVFTETDTKKLLNRGEKNMMNVLKRAVIATVSVMMTAGFALGVSAEEKVKLVLVKGQSATDEQIVMKSVYDKYMEQHPNVEIKVLDGPQSATDLLGLYLQFFQSKSDEVDVLQIDVIWPGDLAEHLLDLNQFGAAEITKDHFPAIVENNTVNGKLVGFPYYTDAGLLYYRTDLLKKYGFEGPPKTWDELETMAQKIQDGERAEGNKDFWGFVWQGSAYEGLTCTALEWIKSSGGGSIIEPDGTISVNNEKAVNMLARAAKWVNTISPAGITGYKEEDSRAVWQGGNAAFMRNWPYCYALGNYPDSVIKGKFDVTPIPGAEAGQSAATLGGWQLAVSKYSKHPEIAVDFAKYLGSKEVQKFRALKLSMLPTEMSLYKDPEILQQNPFMERLYDVFINAVARPSTVTAPNYNQVSTLFFNAVYSVLTGKAEAQAAVEELALNLEDALKK